MAKHLWEYKHPYYSNESNHFANGWFLEYESFAEFLSAWGDADVDMNLIYRWDWEEYDCIDHYEGEPEDKYKGDYLKIFRVLQRKGIYCGQIIKVNKEDEAAVKEYLARYKPTIMSFWKGI